MTATKKNRFAPSFETLEQRQMLTAGATISACLDTQGTLLVNGTNGADRIAIRRTDSNTIGVYCLLGPQTGLVGNYNVHAVNNVIVNTYDGSDHPPGSGGCLWYYAPLQCSMHKVCGRNHLQLLPGPATFSWPAAIPVSAGKARADENDSKP